MNEWMNEWRPVKNAGRLDLNALQELKGVLKKGFFFKKKKRKQTPILGFEHEIANRERRALTAVLKNLTRRLYGMHSCKCAKNVFQ